MYGEEPKVSETTDPGWVSVKELENFEHDPVCWIEAWNQANGMVESFYEEQKRCYVVKLWVQEQLEPMSVGVATSLRGAFENAIKGIDALLTVMNG